jgi:hypothetical protein
MPLAIATLLSLSGLASAQPVAPASSGTPAADSAPIADLDPAMPKEIANAAFYTPPSQRNAALAYYKSFSMMSRDARSKSAEVDWDAVGDNVDGAKMPASFKDAAASRVRSMG